MNWSRQASNDPALFAAVNRSLHRLDNAERAKIFTGVNGEEGIAAPRPFITAEMIKQDFCGGVDIAAVTAIVKAFTGVK
jgi:hypothetical protein